MDVIVTVWAEDCTVRGTVRGDVPERLTDRLNAEARIDLDTVRVEALDEPRTFDIESVSLGLDDLCVVELAGPRGLPERRRGTVRHRIAAEVGPYLVVGTIHSLPGAEPLTTFRRRPPLVPLTDAVIELRAGDGGGRRWEVDAAAINQGRIASIREIPADATGEEGWVATDIGG